VAPGYPPNPGTLPNPLLQNGKGKKKSFKYQLQIRVFEKAIEGLLLF
jgi:hypothetical protein